MASSSHASPQFHQLLMFMTPREIRSQYAPLDKDRHDPANAHDHTDHIESDAELWGRKLRDSQMTNEYTYKEHGSLHADIAANGVGKAVSLQVPDKAKVPQRPMVLEGHHRIASAYDTRPDELIPVQHFNDRAQATRVAWGIER